MAEIDASAIGIVLYHSDGVATTTANAVATTTTANAVAAFNFDGGDRVGQGDGRRIPTESRRFGGGAIVRQRTLSRFTIQDSNRFHCLRRQTWLMNTTLTTMMYFM